jgi:hypothetical protein
VPQGAGSDPRELYGEGFEQAGSIGGKRVNERVQAFDHCFSSPKSVSLLAAGDPNSHTHVLAGRPFASAIVSEATRLGLHH